MTATRPLIGAVRDIARAQKRLMPSQGEIFRKSCLSAFYREQVDQDTECVTDTSQKPETGLDKCFAARSRADVRPGFPGRGARGRTRATLAKAARRSTGAGPPSSAGSAETAPSRGGLATGTPRRRAAGVCLERNRPRRADHGPAKERSGGDPDTAYARRRARWC